MSTLLCLPMPFFFTVGPDLSKTNTFFRILVEGPPGLLAQPNAGSRCFSEVVHATEPTHVLDIRF